MTAVVLAVVLILVAFSALLVALTALDEAKAVRERQDATETRVSALGVQMQKLRREKAGYPGTTPVAHRSADAYDDVRPPLPKFLRDLERSLR